jgi:two-component system, OmpR family, sensor kinase
MNDGHRSSRVGHGMPLRVRITLASVGAMALILTALGAFLFARLDAGLTSAVDLGLQSRAGSIAAGLGQQGSSFSDVPDTGTATVAQILTPAAKVVETTGSSSPLLSAADLGSISSPSYLERPVAGGSAPLRIFVLPTNEGRPLFVVVGSTLDQQRHVLSSFVVLLLVGSLGALALTSAGAWFLTGAALRPIDRMRGEAAAISVSDPGRRLPVPDTNDEVARLGATLNEMLDRLEEALGAERRLLDDASHELRTPLAILKAELDLALSRARTPEELEDALRSASEETDRVARLAEDLLVLSRSKQGRLEIRRQKISLGDLLERVCAAHRARAEDAGVRIELVSPSANVSVDPVRLRQALDNVLDNALRYSPAGSAIRVVSHASEGTVRVVVEDEGIGFQESVLGTAFEPFIRDDSGAVNRHEGAGLGLAIVLAVAKAHGGAASTENLPEGGARVSMSLLDRPSMP